MKKPKTLPYAQIWVIGVLSLITYLLGYSQGQNSMLAFLKRNGIELNQVHCQVSYTAPDMKDEK